MNESNLSADAKLLLHGIVNVGVNTAILSLVPEPWKALAVLLFNIAQLALAYVDPSYAVHLIQTGQMSVPSPDSEAKGQ